ncbi:immunoglobulin-like domain-containing protein [Paenibacillus agaridevorans]|uniref:immunoglobulin-like domain-containing protein n=1 Tax=Paenibacillus agaridevorans TaxID=171404 RepID=UPI001BE48C81|nr:immunoglobulin-like domain-containing protein [Paenibacillus agaridevorans]
MSSRRTKNGLYKFMSIGLCMTLLFSLAGHLASPNARASAASLTLELTNPGFEDGKQGWTQVSGASAAVTIDTTAAYVKEGTKSLKITDNNSSGYMLVSEKAAAAAGKEYTAQAQFYQTGRAAGYAKLSLVFYDEADVEIPVTPIIETSASASNNVWQALTVSAAAPVGTAAVNVKIGTTGAYVSAGAWYDAISLEEEAEEEPGGGGNEETDLANATSDRDALQIEFAQGETADTVKSNVVLPVSGAAGSAITWISSHPDRISPGGHVSRPSSLAGDHPATLTASIQAGSVTLTKSFDLTVMSYPGTITNAGFETGDLTGWTRIAGAAADVALDTIQKSNGNYSLRLQDTSSTAALGMESDQIEAGEGLHYTASSELFIESSSAAIYMRFYDGNGIRLHQASASSSVRNKWQTLQVADTAPAGTKYVSVLLYIGASNVGTSYFDDVKLTSYRDTEILELDRQALEIQFTEGDSEQSVTGNLVLPTQGQYSNIVWQSSHEEYIASDGTVARPTLGTGDVGVTLTAALTAGGQTVARSFHLTVKASGTTMTHVQIPIVNADFEQGLTGWNMKVGAQSAVDTVTTRAYSGQYSLFVDDHSAAQTYTIEGGKELAAPGITYTASAQIYQLERKSSSAYFYLYFYDKGHNLIETKSVGGPYNNSSANNWTPLTIVAVAPAETRYVSTGVGTTSTYIGKVWLDDIKLDAALPADNTAMSDSDAVAADAAALSIGFIGGDTETNVTGHVGLSVIGGHQTIIRWSSNRENVISRNGAVNRSSEAVEVVLTALVTRGMYSQTVHFPLTVAAAVVGSATVGADLLNPGFGDGMSEWAQLAGNPNSVAITSQGYAGNGLEINNEGGAAVVVQSSAVRAEQKMEYTASAKVHIQTGSARLELRFYDSAGNFVMSEGALVEAGPGSWQDLWVRTTAPAGTHHLRVILWADSSEAARFIVDEVKVSGNDFKQDNRGFENGASGWLISTGDGQATIDHTVVFSGESSLKVHAQSGAVPVIEGEKMFAVPGERFSAFSKVYLEAGTANISLRFYDKQQNLLHTEQASVDTPQQGWTNLGVKYEVPEGASYAALMLSVESNSTVWFDETYISKEYTYLGVPIRLQLIQSSAYGKTVDGKDIAYSVMADASLENTHFVGVDLESGETILKIPMRTTQGSFAVIAGSDGNIYVGAYTEGRIYKYVPGAAQLIDLGIAVPGQSSPFSMADGGNGVIYGGTYNSAYVFKYTPGEGFTTVSPHGAGQRFDNEEEYVRGLAVDLENDALYAGIGSHAKLVRYDLATGQTQSLLEQYLTDKTFVYHLKYTGGKLFATTTPSASIMVLDIAKHQDGTVSVEVDDILQDSYVVSNEANGKIYFISADQKLHYYDIASKTQGLVLDPGGAPVMTGVTPMTLSVVQMGNQEDYPGYSLVGMGSVYRGKTGTFVYNLQTGQLRSGPAELPSSSEGARSILLGSDGGIYTGNHLGGGTGVYYPLSGQPFMREGLAQIENGVALGGKTYFGTYTHANLMEYDPSLPWDIHLGGNNPRRVFELNSQYQQDRPFGMAAGDGLVFVGTVPDYGMLGGVIAIYNPATGAPPVVKRNIVQNQSVVALEYADGILYGGTSVWGGLGIDPTETSAKFFAYDVAAGEKLFEMEVAAEKRVITSLITDGSGKIWGMDEGHIFIYDPSSGNIIYNQNLFPEINYAAKTSAVVYGGQLMLGDDGYIYGNTTGKFFRINPETMEVEILRTGGSIFIEKDSIGNIYFSDFTGIVRYTYPDSNDVLDSGLVTAKLEADKGSDLIGYSGSDHAGHITSDLVLAATGVNGALVGWQSSHPEYIGNNGVVVRPASNVGDVTVELVAILQLEGIERKQRFQLTVAAVSEAGGGSGDGDTPPAGTLFPVNPEEKPTAGNSVIEVNITDTYTDMKVSDLRNTLQGQEGEQRVVVSNLNVSFELTLSQLQRQDWLEQLGQVPNGANVRFMVEPLSDQAAAALRLALQQAGAVQIAPAVSFSIQSVDENGTVKHLAIDNRSVNGIFLLDSDVANERTTGVFFNGDTKHPGFAPTSFAIRNGQKLALIKHTGTGIIYTVATSNRSFNDISGHWAEEDILLLANKLLVNGIGSDRFAPDQQVTRAEFAALIARALSLPETAAPDRFSDVQSDSWYSSAVGAATGTGLIQGYTDGAFRPDAVITRAEIVMMLVRAMTYIGMDTTTSEQQQAERLAPFVDSGQLDWAASSMAIAVKNGLVQGKSGSQLDPKGKLTRAEMVVMIKRLLSKADFIAFS